MTNRVHNLAEFQLTCDKMNDLAINCENASSQEEARLLSKIHQQLVQLHENGKLSGLRVLNAARLEELISKKACDTAVLEMVGPGTGYMLSRNPDGSHIASLVLPGKVVEVTCYGSTLALSMLGAIAFAVAENLPA